MELNLSHMSAADKVQQQMEGERPVQALQVTVEGVTFESD